MSAESSISWTLMTVCVNYLLVPLLVLVVVKYKFVWTILQTVRRDVTGAYRGIQTLIYLYTSRILNRTVGSEFNRVVAKYPNKVCFFYEDEKWTFRQVHQFANKVGNYFSSKGFRNGDVVCLFMENCPEYIPMWLGLSKIGVIPALINTNLRAQPLKHSIEIVNCKAVIYGEDISQAIQDVISLGCLSKVPIFSYARDGTISIKSATNLAAVLTSCSIEEPIPGKKINYTDPIVYMYTSGTTGLPKAAVLNHAKIFMGSCFHFMSATSSKDVVYLSLPLYHSAAGNMGVSLALLFGLGIVLRKKFSASNFWTDCIKYDVTVVQYIGEMCRYLLAQPERPQDKQHKVRLIFGVGLRKSIWEEFVNRFGIKNVSEIYGSTEGNCNMINFDGKPGAVGFIPRTLYWAGHIRIIKVDKDTGVIERDPKTGLAITCKPNEPGEMVGRVVKNHVYQDFKGYADAAATKSKFAHDVLWKGDTFFRTGDSMVMDEFGYFYFNDRCGDTFRWKSENVSTAEVEAVISNLCDLKDCVVYGVQIPATEGRAGMATIVDPDSAINLEDFAHGLKKSLPSYARPLFVRFTNYIDLTGTFKLKKVDLQEEGFNIHKIQDSVYFFHPSVNKYVKLDENLYNDLMTGKVRV